MVNHLSEKEKFKKTKKSNDPEFIEGPNDPELACREFIELVEGPNWFVYIAEARTKRYYVGITTNPMERIKKHNSGKGSKFAINQGPFTLVYISDAFPNKSSARTREAQLKKWTRDKKRKLISGEWD